MTSPFGRPKRRPYIVTLFIAFILIGSKAASGSSPIILNPHKMEESR